MYNLDDKNSPNWQDQKSYGPVIHFLLQLILGAIYKLRRQARERGFPNVYDTT